MQLGKDPLPNLPPGWVIKAAVAFRQKVLDWANSLAPPELVLSEWFTGMARTKIAHTVAVWGIADVIDEQGPQTGAALAARLGTDPDATHRMMRACVAAGLFALDGEQRFVNNRLSHALLRKHDTSASHAAMYWGSASNARAWFDFENVVKTGKNAFGRLFGMSVWEWFDQHPDERDTFANMMSITTTQMAPIVATLYPDFGQIARLCDVAGGRGILLSELLVRNPDMRGLLFDNPGVLALAGTLLEARGVRARVELHPGSFFEPTIPHGADAYLLKNILHDWDDARSITILQHVRRACDPGKKLLLCEMLVEQHDTHFGALADVHMMTVCDEGRERGRDDFARLCEQSGWKLARVFPHPVIAVLEAIAV